MAHHNTVKGNSYNSLAKRLHKFPQGAPPTKFLFNILSVLFSEREAKLVSLLPIKPFTGKKAAGIWKMTESDARIILNDLADRGILLDYENNGEITYSLPPPMAGFFEFSLMRYRTDIAMAAVLGAILKLPPAKQILASNQFRSRYLLALIKKFNKQH